MLSTGSRGYGWRLAGIAGATFALSSACRIAAEPSCEQALSDATEAVAKRRPDAESQVRKLLSRRPQSAEGIWLLGNLYASRDDHAGALACFRQIPKTNPNWRKAFVAQGDQLLALGDAVRAEEIWKDSSSSELCEADKRFVALYGLQLRRDEWAASLWKLIDADGGSLRELVQIIIVEHVVWQGEGIVETLQQFVAANPDDRPSRCSLVHHLLAAGRAAEAKEQLDQLKNGDSLPEALAGLAYAVSEADWEAAEPYLRSPAREGWRQSAAWRRAVGELELQRGSPVKALPDLLESAKKAPFHPAGRQQLSLALRLLGRPAEAELHAAAAAVLARLDRGCHAMQTAGTWTPDEVREVVRDAASIGKIEEAKAWVRFVLKQRPDDQRWTSLLRRLNEAPPTGRARPPASFPDPRKEAARW